MYAVINIKMWYWLTFIVVSETLQKEIIGMWHLSACKVETISLHLFPKLKESSFHERQSPKMPDEFQDLAIMYQ